MRVLVFGDSITQGYWAIDHGWVDRARKFYDTLQIEDLDGRDDPSIFNLGISADNSEDILKRIKAEVTARTRTNHTVKPVVVVQIGVNDCSMEPTEPQVSIEKYKEYLRQIADLIKPLSSRVIFVGFAACDESKTTPVSWGEYYYTNQNIKAYEDAMAQVAALQGVSFIPVFEQFKLRVDAGDDLLPDGLHPNDAGHELAYQIIMPKLQELLK